MISFVEVSKQFNKLYVLNQINLEIKAGDHIALVGANGAGKTTLIRCLLGEYRYEGHILVDNLNPLMHRQAVLTQIGFVPQHPPPLKIPVGQLLYFAAHICGSHPDRMIALAHQLGLKTEDLLSRPFVKLSGGQKQKLLISIALGRDSRILILDEPAANLDPEARQVFFNLLREKQKDVITLISSHRLDELTTLVNRVLELDMGKVVKDSAII